MTWGLVNIEGKEGVGDRAGGQDGWNGRGSTARRGHQADRREYDNIGILRGMRWACEQSWV